VAFKRLTILNKKSSITHFKQRQKDNGHCPAVRHYRIHLILIWSFSSILVSLFSNTFFLIYGNSDVKTSNYSAFSVQIAQNRLSRSCLYVMSKVILVWTFDSKFSHILAENRLRLLAKFLLNASKTEDVSIQCYVPCELKTHYRE